MMIRSVLKITLRVWKNLLMVVGVSFPVSIFLRIQRAIKK